MPTIIAHQPSTAGLSYCRSPILYRINGMVPEYTYDFILKTSITTKAAMADYITIRRVPDLVSGTTFDVSNILCNYLSGDINYGQPNVAYFLLDVEVYSGSTLLYTLHSSTGLTSMGYTYYGEDPNGYINYTDSESDIILNSQVVETPYYIPYEHYELAMRHKKDLVDIYKFDYTDVNGDPQSFWNYIPTSIPYAFLEVYWFNCGYKDLIESYSKTDLDITKPYTFTLLTGSTEVYKYYFYPDYYCDLTTIQFMNKWGVWDMFYFHGRKDTSLTIDSDVYKYNNLSNSTMTYEIKEGQYHKRFIQGRGKLTLNTGWIDEVKNEKLEQLLMSEYVFDYNTSMPYIITDKEIKYKTVKYDKLIEYTLTLEEAFDKMNSVV